MSSESKSKLEGSAQGKEWIVFTSFSGMSVYIQSEYGFPHGTGFRENKAPRCNFVCKSTRGSFFWANHTPKPNHAVISLVFHMMAHLIKLMQVRIKLVGKMKIGKTLSIFSPRASVTNSWQVTLGWACPYRRDCCIARTFRGHISRGTLSCLKHGATVERSSPKCRDE